MRVVLCSTSPIKLAALLGAARFHQLNFHITQLEVSSDYFAQPCGLNEALTAAHHRIKNARQADPSADYYIAADTGVFSCSAARCELRSAVMLQDQLGEHTYTACSLGEPIPEHLFLRAKAKGLHRHTVDEYLQPTLCHAHPDNLCDPHSPLSRTWQLTHAFCQLLPQAFTHLPVRHPSLDQVRPYIVSPLGLTSQVSGF